MQPDSHKYRSSFPVARNLVDSPLASLSSRSTDSWSEQEIRRLMQLNFDEQPIFRHDDSSTPGAADRPATTAIEPHIHSSPALLPLDERRRSASEVATEDQKNKPESCTACQEGKENCVFYAKSNKCGRCVYKRIKCSRSRRLRKGLNKCLECHTLGRKCVLVPGNEKCGGCIRRDQPCSFTGKSTKRPAQCWECRRRRQNCKVASADGACDSCQERDLECFFPDEGPSVPGHDAQRDDAAREQCATVATSRTLSTEPHATSLASFVNGTDLKASGSITATCERGVASSGQESQQLRESADLTERLHPPKPEPVPSGAERKKGNRCTPCRESKQKCVPILDQRKCEQCRRRQMKCNLFGEPRKLYSGCLECRQNKPRSLVCVVYPPGNERERCRKNGMSCSLGKDSIIM